MRPDPRRYLWDAVRAAEMARGFAEGRSFADYQSDAMLRSAVERVAGRLGGRARGTDSGGFGDGSQESKEFTQETGRPSDQRWFWTAELQEREREVDEEITQGQLVHGDVDALLAQHRRAGERRGVKFESAPPFDGPATFEFVRVDYE